MEATLARILLNSGPRLLLLLPVETADIGRDSLAATEPCDNVGEQEVTALGTGEMVGVVAGELALLE